MHPDNARAGAALLEGLGLGAVRLPYNLTLKEKPPLVTNLSMLVGAALGRGR